ncbi:hypothetical protein TWF281_006609 [Arthrobotrys megalospora]
MPSRGAIIINRNSAGALFLRNRLRLKQRTPPKPSTTWNKNIFTTLGDISYQNLGKLWSCKVLLSSKVPRSISKDIGCNERLVRELLGGIDEDEYHRLLVRFGRTIFATDGMALLSLGCPTERRAFIDGMNALLSDNFLADLSLGNIVEGADITIYWPKIHQAVLAGNEAVVGYALYKVAVEAKAIVLSGEWEEMNAFYWSTSYKMAHTIIWTSDHFLVRVLAASRGIRLNLESCISSEPPEEMGVALRIHMLLSKTWSIIVKMHFIVFATVTALEVILLRGIKGRFAFAFIHYEICLVILLLGLVDDWLAWFHQLEAPESED